MESTTRTCPHCGAVREPIRLRLGDHEVVAGHKPCGCPQAAADRMEAMRREDEEKRRREERELQDRLTKAGIPRRYLTAEDPRAVPIRDAAENGRGAYIYGTHGTGKTTIAMAAARLLIMDGAKVKVCIAPQLMEQMRARTTEDQALTARIRSCDVLVLDDLGKESPTPYACERLWDVLNDRYNEMRPVIVTSNYTRGDLAQRLDCGGSGDNGRSIASRLADPSWCRKLHIDGTDRRLHG